MSGLELSLLLLTVLGVFLGAWSICWARTSQQPARALWGQRLFVVTLLCLGACNLVAAGCRANALAPLGLSAGLLVVAMLWENPPATRAVGEPISWPEER